MIYINIAIWRQMINGKIDNYIDDINRLQENQQMNDIDNIEINDTQIHR